MNEETIYRVRIADIRARETDAPGYASALLASGVADADGVHWRIPLADYLAIRARFKMGEGGCGGCGN
jgi:hypothetical protein